MKVGSGRMGMPGLQKKKGEGMRSPRRRLGHGVRPGGGGGKGPVKQAKEGAPTEETMREFDRVFGEMQTDPMSPGGMPEGRLVRHRGGASRGE